MGYNNLSIAKDHKIESSSPWENVQRQVEWCEFWLQESLKLPYKD
jgi:hypothetical protein